MKLVYDLNGIRKHLSFSPAALGVVPALSEMLIGRVPPSETAMLTLELRFVSSGLCRIIAEMALRPEHLGRTEIYGNCVFSGYSDRIGTIVVLNDVRSLPSFLALDKRVRSEMFLERPLNRNLHVILNAEFLTVRVSKEAMNWFGGLAAKVLAARS